MQYFNSSQDFFYTTAASSLTYVLTCDGEFVYTGRCVKSPSAAEMKINVAERVRDWTAQNMPDFRQFDGEVVQHPYAYRVFELRDDLGTLLETYGVLLDWGVPFTGADLIMSEPVNGHVDARQKIFWSSFGLNARQIPIEFAADLHISFNPAPPFYIHSSGGTLNISYTANTEFTFSYNGGGWFTATAGGGTISITANENTGDTRSGSVCFSYLGSDFQEHTVCYQVSQQSNQPYFSVSPSITIYGWEEGVGVTARTNVSYTITTNANWITDSGHTDLGNNTTELFLYTGMGDMDSSRTATVYVWYQGIQLASFTLTQTQVDFGGAILGIAATPESFYIRTDYYKGVYFANQSGTAFTAPDTGLTASGYVETRTGLVSHIGTLGSSSSIAPYLVEGLIDCYCEFQMYNWAAGDYHTIIFPKNMTSITRQGPNPEQSYFPTSPLFTRYGANWKSANTRFINPPYPLVPEFSGSTRASSCRLKNIYWRSTYPITDGLLGASMSDNWSRWNSFFSNLEYLYTNATGIGASAFADTKLKKIDGLENALTIGRSAFQGVQLEHPVSFASGVTIESYAFSGATVPFSSISNTGMGWYAFSDATIPTSSLTITGGYVGRNTFYNVSGPITSLELNDVIGLYAYCFMIPNLESVKITSGSITDAMFQYMDNLTYAEIDKSVSPFLHDTSGGTIVATNVRAHHVFYRCPNITNITFKGTKSEFDTFCGDSTPRDLLVGDGTLSPAQVTIHCTDGDIII